MPQGVTSTVIAKMYIIQALIELDFHKYVVLSKAQIFRGSPWQKT